MHRSVNSVRRSGLSPDARRRFDEKDSLIISSVTIIPNLELVVLQTIISRKLHLVSLLRKPLVLYPLNAGRPNGLSHPKPSLCEGIFSQTWRSSFS
ncbi:hypothetical protein AVEN_98596-1 [Araneus ventricosus]|uniref:Uncharacterized protein n=1 Tax=Araneus ventricosus TaxID=182803 RepID=A0A4Y2CWZ4_ARAVE|nr:hypothetical protein AVEN_98596-1 [Araneus ventricosus]